VSAPGSGWSTRRVAAGPALESAAGLGPYFSWTAHPDGARWRPLTDLDDGDVVAERVEVGRESLRRSFGLAEDQVPPRVVASVLFLGLASRLLSPVLGAAVVGGAVPLAGRGHLWWRPVPSGPWPIACAGVDAVPVAGLDDAAVGGLIDAVAVHGLVAPLLDVFRDRFRLSAHVLRGNVASALAGAAGIVADSRPEHADRAGRIVERVLALPALAGSGDLVRPDPARSRRFLVRGNCCLYYRIPGGGTCGDCILTPDADRRRGWRSVLSRTAET
jgi:hypothetical protein